jgi:hypothetical protein
MAQRDLFSQLSAQQRMYDNLSVLKRDGMAKRLDFAKHGRLYSGERLFSTSLVPGRRFCGFRLLDYAAYHAWLFELRTAGMKAKEIRARHPSVQIDNNELANINSFARYRAESLDPHDVRARLLAVNDSMMVTAAAFTSAWLSELL